MTEKSDRAEIIRETGGYLMVETAYGKIIGTDMGDYVEYRGIPYARPPHWGAALESPSKAGSI